jgi:Tol biopolymer transport system component
VGGAVVAPDGKTIFVTRFASVDVTDVSGATPRKLFDTFYGSIACAPSNCYFGGAINDQLGVYRFKIGESPRLMFSGWAEDLDVNRAGDRLLLQRRGREGQSTEIVVRRVNADAQTVERSGDSLHDASWHPDGKSILYLESFKGAVVLQDLASGKQTNIPTATGATVVGAAWETHGTYVLAYTTTQTAGEFWILRPDGQSVGPILRDEEKVRYSRLRTTPLPDTFSAVRWEEHTSSGVASLERQADERLIGRPNIRGPFSWLGPERLLYTAKDASGSWIAEYDIYAQQDRRLSPTGLISNPAITPDGTRLVFEMERGAESGLWTSPVEDWNPVKLTELPILAHAISPDSKWVAFAAFGGEGGLYVTPLEGGGEVRRLARGSIWQVSFAGTQTVVFGRWSDGRQPLCKVSRDGGPESCFALDDTQRFVTSPAGKTIAAVTHTAGSRTQLHFIDITSGVVGKVVTLPSWIDTDGGIAWTADGARIVYATDTSPFTTAIESYRIADGSNEVLIKPVEGRITNITVSPDGRYATFQRRSGWSDAVLLTVTP